MGTGVQSHWQGPVLMQNMPLASFFNKSLSLLFPSQNEAPIRGPRLTSSLHPGQLGWCPQAPQHQPSNVHWLCRAWVHFPGQEAWLQGDANYDRLMLGPLSDLGGEWQGLPRGSEKGSIPALPRDAEDQSWHLLCADAVPLNHRPSSWTRVRGWKGRHHKHHKETCCSPLKSSLKLQWPSMIHSLFWGFFIFNLDLVWTFLQTGDYPL